jgi:predicted esterase
MIEFVRRLILASTLCFLSFTSSYAQESQYPYTTIMDLSEIEYKYESELIVVDHADSPSGYWMYFNEKSVASNAPVVIFMHGYGGYNPFIYGAWIRHLVRKGNIVIYPRYQKNLVFPRPDRFAPNAARGIKGALSYLNETYNFKVPEEANYVGHSYGGTIISEFLVRSAEYEIPEPKVAMLCAPGTSSLKGGRLDSYGEINQSTKLLIVEEGNDRVVGKEFSRKVFNESPASMNKALIVNYPQVLPSNYYDAHHNVCYALDFDFDTKDRNYTSNRALEVGEIDAFDYNFYWRLFDLLCIENEEAFSLIFGNGSFSISNNKKEGLEDVLIRNSSNLLTVQE